MFVMEDSEKLTRHFNCVLEKKNPAAILFCHIFIHIFSFILLLNFII